MQIDCHAPHAIVVVVVVVVAAVCSRFCLVQIVPIVVVVVGLAAFFLAGSWLDKRHHQIRCQMASSLPIVHAKDYLTIAIVQPTCADSRLDQAPVCLSLPYSPVSRLRATSTLTQIRFI
jgi:hypothetical protein